MQGQNKAVVKIVIPWKTRIEIQNLDEKLDSKHIKKNLWQKAKITSPMKKAGIC